MAPKLEQACVDSVKTVYKMKRAEVKVRRVPSPPPTARCVCLVPRSHLCALLLHLHTSAQKVTGEEEDVPEVKAGGGPARRATTGSREVVVSVKVVLPTHNIVTLMDGINGVQIASVARPDSVEAALNVAVGDIVTAVNGAGVAGLPAAEVMREIRRWVTSVVPRLVARRRGRCSRAPPLACSVTRPDLARTLPCWYKASGRAVSSPPSPGMPRKTRRPMVRHSGAGHVWGRAPHPPAGAH